MQILKKYSSLCFTIMHIEFKNFFFKLKRVFICVSNERTRFYMRFKRPNAFSHAFFYALSTRYQRVISRYFALSTRIYAYLRVYTRIYALSTPVFEFPGCQKRIFFCQRRVKKCKSYLFPAIFELCIFFIQSPLRFTYEMTDVF